MGVGGVGSLRLRPLFVPSTAVPSRLSRLLWINRSSQRGGAFLFSGFSPAFLILFLYFSYTFLILFLYFSSAFKEKKRKRKGKEKGKKRKRKDKKRARKDKKRQEKTKRKAGKLNPRRNCQLRQISILYLLFLYFSSLFLYFSSLFLYFSFPFLILFLYFSFL